MTYTPITGARLVYLRHAIRDYLIAERNSQSLTVKNFLIGEAYVPFTALENIPSQGKVWLLGLSSDQDVLTRPGSNTCEETIPITIGFQALLQKNPQSEEAVAQIDNYVLFVEQLKDLCRNLNHRVFGWVRNEAMRDPSGVPYSFTGLRSANLFESYFLAHYKCLISRK